MDYLKQHIEAIIFTAENPVRLHEISECLCKVFGVEDLPEEEIEKAISQIAEKFAHEDHAFELKKIGGGYQFLSKVDYHKTISTFLNQKLNKRLSGASLETLSIIAYKQPVTKAEIEAVRGVNCDYAIQRLLEKDLVEIAGKKDAPGMPVLYQVSKTFLDYFGINSTEELPKLREVLPEEVESTIGINTEMADNETETGQADNEDASASRDFGAA